MNGGNIMGGMVMGGNMMGGMSMCGNMMEWECATMFILVNMMDGKMRR